MLIVSHRTLYIISGAVWLVVGCMLLNLGIKFLMHGLGAAGFAIDGYSSLFVWITSLTSSAENAAIVLVALALLLGFAKGKLVMQKAALKTQMRLSQLPNPTSLKQLYSKANLILLFLMMGMGMLMNKLQLPYDIRGMIDVAVGSALIQGALCYFRLNAPSKTHA